MRSMLLPVAVLLAGLACGCDEPGCARPELAADAINCGPINAANSEAERASARECVLARADAQSPFFIEWDDGGVDAAYTAIVGARTSQDGFGVFWTSESDDGWISTIQCGSLVGTTPAGCFDDYQTCLQCLDGAFACTDRPE